MDRLSYSSTSLTAFNYFFVAGHRSLFPFDGMTRNMDRLHIDDGDLTTSWTDRRAMRIRRTVSAPIQRSGLHRSLGLCLLVLYGLGMIIGAGVYVVIGDVMAQAGPMAVCSFALAGMFAGLVALSYAELGARYPEAAGAAAYVREAFKSDRGSQVTGATVAARVLISTATIARGTAGYAQAFVALPDTFIAGLVVVVFTAVACLGVKDSVRVAAVMTIIELAGLLLVISVGVTAVRHVLDHVPTLVPTTFDAWI